MNGASQIGPRGSYRGTRQRVIFGVGSILRLGEVLQESGVSRALVVMGPTVASTPLVDILRRSVGACRLEAYSGSREHAPQEACREGLRFAQDTKAECLISLGGSSPVDVAKGIAILSGERRDFDQIPQRAKPEPKTTMPLLCVTTTLSQSEFTNVAGITNEATGTKHQYSAAGILPACVFLDAGLTTFTPERLWLSTGVKALDTAINIYLLHKESQPFRDPLVLQAVRDLITLLPKSRARPGDLSVRQRLQLAAWMGAFPGFHLPVDSSVPTSRGWLGSAARHQIGAMFRARHGEIAGILISHALEFHLEDTRDRQQVLAETVGERGPDGLRRFLAELTAELGLPTRLREIGVDEDQLPTLAVAIVEEQSKLGSQEAVLVALKRAY
jgi:alcohol dehydrogenase